MGTRRGSRSKKPTRLRRVPPVEIANVQEGALGSDLRAHRERARSNGSVE